MNIFVKIAVFVVVILIIAILINHFLPAGPEINNKGAMDPESALVERSPAVADSNTADKRIASRRGTPRKLRRPRRLTNPDHRPPPPNLKIPPSDRTPRPSLPERLQKKKEILEQQQPEYINVRAGQLYQMAVTESKIARKPMMTYKRMVDYCRRILRYHPNTKYASMARELLRDMPESQRKRYNITDWELGLQTQTTEENQR